MIPDNTTILFPADVDYERMFDAGLDECTQTEFKILASVGIKQRLHEPRTLEDLFAFFFGLWELSRRDFDKVQGNTLSVLTLYATVPEGPRLLNLMLAGTPNIKKIKFVINTAYDNPTKKSTLEFLFDTVRRQGSKKDKLIADCPLVASMIDPDREDDLREHLASVRPSLLRLASIAMKFAQPSNHN